MAWHELHHTEFQSSLLFSAKSPNPAKFKRRRYEIPSFPPQVASPGAKYPNPPEKELFEFVGILGQMFVQAAKEGGLCAEARWWLLLSFLLLLAFLLSGCVYILFCLLSILAGSGFSSGKTTRRHPCVGEFWRIFFSRGKLSVPG